MLRKKDIKFFKIAKEISRLSRFPRIKIGAIVVQKNRIISTGYNKVKTHPLQKEYNHNCEYDIDLATNFIHAEIDALKNISYMDLSSACIYIFRMNAHGKLAMCRPCPACMSLIRDCKIKHVYYTTDKGYAYERVDY